MTAPRSIFVSLPVKDLAAAHGGKADVHAPIDMGWLYNRAFEDPDGNALEAYWLDPKAG